MAKTGFIFGVVHVSRDKKDLLFRRQESGNHETCMYRYISTFQTKTNQTHIHVYSPFLHLFFKIITKFEWKSVALSASYEIYSVSAPQRLFYLDKQLISAILRFIQNVFKIHGHLFHMASLYTHANICRG